MIMIFNNKNSNLEECKRAFSNLIEALNNINNIVKDIIENREASIIEAQPDIYDVKVAKLIYDDAIEQAMASLMRKVNLPEWIVQLCRHVCTRIGMPVLPSNSLSAVTAAIEKINSKTPIVSQAHIYTIAAFFFWLGSMNSDEKLSLKEWFDNPPPKSEDTQQPQEDSRKLQKEGGFESLEDLQKWIQEEFNSLE